MLIFRAVKHRRSLLLVRSKRMLRLLSSTSLRQLSTRLLKPRSTESLTRSQATKPPSTSPTVCPLVSSAMRSLCSTRALLFSKAPTLLSLPTQMANTTSCGTHRRSIIRKQHKSQRVSHHAAPLNSKKSIAKYKIKRSLWTLSSSR